MISMHSDLHVYMCHYVNEYIDRVLPEYIDPIINGTLHFRFSSQMSNG